MVHLQVDPCLLTRQAPRRASGSKHGLRTSSVINVSSAIRQDALVGVFRVLQLPAYPGGVRMVELVEDGHGVVPSGVRRC